MLSRHALPLLFVTVIACRPPCQSSTSCESSERCVQGDCLPAPPGPGPSRKGRRNPAVVTVTVFEDIFNRSTNRYVRVPSAGLDVVFHDQAGAPISFGKTDSLGRIAGDVGDKGMVTVIRANGFGAYAHTIQDVPPFSTIELGKYGDSTNGELSVTTNVSVPPPPPGADWVEIGTGCTFTGGRFQLVPAMGNAAWGPKCVSGDWLGSALFLAVNQDAQAGCHVTCNPIAFATLVDFPVRRPMPSAGAWRTDWDERRIETHDTRAGDVVEAKLTPMRYRSPFWLETSKSETAAADGVVSVSVPVVPDFAEAYRQTVVVRRSRERVEATSLRTENVDAATPPTARNLQTEFLPFIRDAVYIRGTRIVGFDADIAPGADYVLVTLSDERGFAYRRHIAPGHLRTIRFAQLPPQLERQLMAVQPEHALDVFISDDGAIENWETYLRKFDLETGSRLEPARPDESTLYRSSQATTRVN